MTRPDRKALIRDYRENPPPAGIFQVKNIVTGKLLVGPAPNLPGMLNRQRFQLEMGSHPDKELQAHWNELGPDAFEFSVLDELQPAEDPTIDPAEELDVLLQMWLDKLEGTQLYRLSTRGA